MKLLLMCSLFALSHGYSLSKNLGVREERSTDKIEELKTKLAKLQGLLRDIELGETADAKGAGTGDVSGADKTKEPMTTQRQLDRGDAPNMKIKKFVETMTPRDVQTLRELKKMVERARQRHMRPKSLSAEERGEDENPGTFIDRPVGDEEETSKKKYDWRDLARELQSEKGASYLQRKMNDEPFREDPLSVKSGEGTFGAFRDEIKQSVEKNLLSDIALAIHSGISLDEIISDLTDPDFGPDEIIEFGVKCP